MCKYVEYHSVDKILTVKQTLNEYGIFIQKIYFFEANKI